MTRSGQARRGIPSRATLEASGGDAVGVLLVLVGFLVVVGALAVRFRDRTRGQACCTPADPDRDLRMRPAGSRTEP